MGDPKWFGWAHIIDPTTKPSSWWKRYNATLATSISLLSLLVAAMAVWYAREKVISEQKPLLEIVEAMKDGTTIYVKNSGRSPALMVRNELWCDLGKLDANSKGSTFKVEFSMPTGSKQAPDLPTGGTFEVGPFIPWQGLFKEFDAHYTGESVLRLRGILHYQDAGQHHYELPWCYECLHPKSDKPGFFPCWYMESQSWR
jgi:hypothetical protein